MNGQLIPTVNSRPEAALRYPIRITVILTRRYALRKESKQIGSTTIRTAAASPALFFTLCVVSAPAIYIAYNIIWHTNFMRRNSFSRKNSGIT
jgi:hypothetical protein